MLAESLIQNNANINERNPDGWTPLTEAAFKGMIKAKTRGAFKGKGERVLNFNFYLFPVNAGHENIVDLLIRNGAQVNNRDNMNRTPLYMAAELGFKFDILPNHFR